MIQFGANYWASYAGPGMWRDFRPPEIQADLEALSKAGVQYVRFCLFWADFMPTKQVIEPVMLDRLEQFLQLLEQNNLRGHLSFLVGHMSGQNWSPDWLHDPSQLLSSSELLEVQERYLTAVVTRVKNQSSLEAYIFSNEISLFTGNAQPEVVQAWAQRLYACIKKIDPDKPIGIGDGGWSNLGPPSGFSSELPQDFIGPHVYEMDTHPERQIAGYGLAIAAATANAAGKPVWLEEFGAPHNVNSEHNNAEWAKKVVLEARLQGASRFCWWCGTDFDLPNQDPYRHHGFEQTFGLLRRDRSVRPVVQTLLEAIHEPLPDLPEVGLLVTSYLTEQYPFNIAAKEEEVLTKRALRNAYVALRRLGYIPRVIHEKQFLAGQAVPNLLVIPSVQKLLSPTWALLEQHQGRVLYSYFHGLASWRGVWTNRAASFFGGKPQNRYGLPETAPQKLIVNHLELPLERHADPFVSTPLLITPITAEVLGRDDLERPMWLRLEQRDLLLYPVEALSENPDTVENIYRTILK